MFWIVSLTLGLLYICAVACSDRVSGPLPKVDFIDTWHKWRDSKGNVYTDKPIGYPTVSNERTIWVSCEPDQVSIVPRYFSSVLTNDVVNIKEGKLV